MDYYTAMAVIGLAGSGLVIVAFFANQQGWLASDGWRYLVLNLVGACLILCSLIAEWNLPSFIIELFWAAISLFGLVRWWRSRARRLDVPPREA
jgi:hypothetical protein